ncbi:MAG: hypothetical protein PHU25_14430 [Deltaproteobacteria bacterium]|nr:hypothetical protein [Deltaproteobacteria bacterium]
MEAHPMGRFLDELKRAFAVDPGPKPDILPEPLERLAHAVVERRMEAPAVLLLESVRPLSFLGSQVLHAVEPLVRAVFAARDLPVVARALEDRRSVELLVRRIEELSAAGAAPR